MSDVRQDLGLLALRVGVGATLFAHGAQKLFGWFGGGGIEGTAGGMRAMGFHPPKRSAVMAGLGEAGGGVLLALGLATPVGGAAATSTMIAAGAVHRPAGFFAMEGGFEYAGVLGLTGAALAVSGPGRYSLDRVLGHRLDRPWLAVAALTLLTSASGVLVAQRSKALAAASAASAASDQPAEGMHVEATGGTDAPAS